MIHSSSSLLRIAVDGCRCLSRLAMLVVALFLGWSAPRVHAQTSAVKQEVIPPFEKEILAFEASDKTNPPPKDAALFIGSSSIRLWKSLAADFPKHKVINRGFGGSHISDSVNYAERIAIPYHPRLIVFYAGGNDIHGGKTPERVFADYKAFVAKIHAALPRTRIAYISIAGNPSRWAEVERVKEANRLIEAHTKTDPRLHFINVFPRMLGEDGQPRPEIFVADRLHMNERGYQLWKEIVGPYLD
jgi:lysophospholipase L1-like esterase